MPEHITIPVCHEYRKEIFGSIFPRWALIIALILIFTALGALYGMNGAVGLKLGEVTSKNNVMEATFKIEIEHIKKGQDEIKAELIEQRQLLRRIEKAVNGG